MITVPHPLASAASARPQHPACVGDTAAVSAAALCARVQRRAAWLADAGVHPQARVALAGPPSVDWVTSFHAIGWLGAVVVPLPPRAPDAALRRIYARLEPAWTLSPADAQVEAAVAVRDALAPLAGSTLLTPPPGDDGPPLPERFWPLDEERVVLLTSGTTGAATSVALTTGQLLLSAVGSMIRLGHHVDDRWLACLPLHHVGGLSILVRCAWYGTTVLVHERFEAHRVATALDAGEATLVSLVPAMLERVLDARPAEPFPPSLRAILLGGSPLLPTLRARCQELGAPVAVTWGMTETASQVATAQVGDLDPASGCGAPLPFARVDTIDGILRVRGPLAGPVHPGRSAELVTRDRGWVDSGGHVHVAGRLDDVINSGGMKIAPEGIEAVLCSHDAVAEAAVLKMASAAWGERPVAALVSAPGNSRPSSAELRRWCRHRLQGFEVPDRFVWCNALPRDRLGKVQRKRLQERLAKMEPTLGHGPGVGDGGGESSAAEVSRRRIDNAQRQQRGARRGGPQAVDGHEET